MATTRTAGFGGSERRDPRGTTTSRGRCCAPAARMRPGRGNVASSEHHLALSLSVTAPRARVRPRRKHTITMGLFMPPLPSPPARACVRGSPGGGVRVCVCVRERGRCRARGSTRAAASCRGSQPSSLQDQRMSGVCRDVGTSVLQLSLGESFFLPFLFSQMMDFLETTPGESSSACV